MAVVGLDLGAANFVVAQVKRGGVDVILNESSKRLNPSLVSFGGSERFIGEAAVPHTRSNYKNTVAQVKRLLGRKASEPAVQNELADHLVYQVEADQEKEVAIRVSYNDQDRTFSPQQIAAMLMQKVKEIVAGSAANDARGSGRAQSEAEAKVFGQSAANGMDIAVAVPAYYTQRMRRAVLDACQIAGVNCLRLINEPTAAALGYGIFRSAKREFFDDRDTKVLFLDAGHSAFTASVVAFRNGSLRMLGVASDPVCGSRDIDVALAKHFASDFKAKTGAEAWTKPKARLKLLAQAEKTKKELSPYGVNQSSVNIECVAEDQDYRTTLTLEQFEELCAPVADRIPDVIKRALQAAGLAPSDLAAVELVGGGARPRIMKRRMAQAIDLPLDEATGHGLGTQLNMDEAVARGTALACAMLSPKFRVKPFDVFDSISFPVTVQFPKESGETESMVLFHAGEPCPVTRRLTFRHWGSFGIHSHYATDDQGENVAKQVCQLPEGQPRDLARFNVEGLEAPADATSETKAPKVRVDLRVDQNGCLTVSRAEHVEELPPPEAETKTEDAEMASPKEAPEATEAAEGAPAAGQTDEAGAAAEGASEAKETVKPEQPAKPAKKRYRRVELPVKVDKLEAEGSLPEESLRSAAEVERTMLQQDEEIRAKHDKRNELESYIYAMRSAIHDGLASYTKPEETETFSRQLTDMEDWLYGDGFDASKEEYERQLAELKKIGGPIEARRIEHEGRDAAAASLLQTIEDYKAVLSSTEERYTHLSDADRDTLRAATKEAEEWLRNAQNEQGRLPMNEDPVLRMADMASRRDALHKECAPIKNKPKPKPPAPAAAPAPAPESAPEASAEASQQDESAEDAAAVGEKRPRDDADKAAGEAGTEDVDMGGAAGDAEGAPAAEDVDMKAQGGASS